MVRIAVLSWALYLFLASTGAGGDAFAWLKMSELFDHFEEHLLQEEEQGNGDFSVFDFLSMHYGSNEHHDTDGDDHKGLPFFNPITFAFVALLPASEDVASLFVPNSKRASSLYSMYEPSAPMNSLFRPPLA